MNKLLGLLLVAALFGATTVFAASSANTTADALCSVITSIGISKANDLQFGSATQGDSSKTIDPTTDQVNAAKFSVTGEASTAYTVTLPASAINMITDDGSSADEIIVVDTWASDPTPTGMLSAGGTQDLYVGATRAAIRATQVTGSYSGSFTVTVAY